MRKIRSVIIATVTVGAIVLAGGVGSRMRPLTDDCPKPLLPLGAEPLLGYQLRRLAFVGVRQVVIATGYLAQRFDRTLGTGRRWNVQLSYSVERQPLGTGGALRAAAMQLPEADRVIVVNGDLLSSHDLSGHLAAAPADAICVHVRAVPDVAPYGRVKCDSAGRVREFSEKTGSGPGLVNAGTYVVPADVLRSLPSEWSSWERDHLPALIAAGRSVIAWESDGYFRDVGTPEAYRLASIDAVRGSLPDGLPYQDNVYVAPDATISSDARLMGGTSVHQGVVVEPGAVLDACVVLAGARVGGGARLERCVVAAGVVVPSGATLREQIVAGCPY